jgi:pyruvate dehydrogenase phosphatase
VKYIDLKPFRDRDPVLLLFSDGIDNLVDGCVVFHPGASCKEPPSAVVGALLGKKIDPRMENILGHQVESRWDGCGGNRAIEVLGNLLGGTDVERLLMTTDPPPLPDPDYADFYIDDTSIIICDLSHSTCLSI